MEDEKDENKYYPTYRYSYEQESYEFLQSFELEEIDSYAFEYVDSASLEEPSFALSYSYSFGYSYGFGGEFEGRSPPPPPPPPAAVQSVTSMDVSS